VYARRVQITQLTPWFEAVCARGHLATLTFSIPALALPFVRMSRLATSHPRNTWWQNLNDGLLRQGREASFSKGEASVITAMPRIAVATRDFAGIVSTFRDALGLPLVDVSAASAQSLGAKLAMCVAPGGSNIELMCPADATAPLSQSLQKFLDRRGDGLFALMLEAPDPNAEAELLTQRGLNVLPLMAGAGGRDVHPRSTHGVLIRIYPVDSFTAEPEAVQRNRAQALGLSGVVRVVIVVNDLDHAAQVYGQGFTIASGARGLDAARGVATATFEPAAGGVIELVSPVDESRPFAATLAAQLAGSGEGLFALVLQASDPTAVGDALQDRGLRVRPCAGVPGAIEIDPGTLFGVRLLIEP
jgi:catechol 2,3-dioxygenase-like lactoylglutathione lyase family enzyme